jgi:hypothetical protein
MTGAPTPSVGSSIRTGVIVGADGERRGTVGPGTGPCTDAHNTVGHGVVVRACAESAVRTTPQPISTSPTAHATRGTDRRNRGIPFSLARRSRAVIARSRNWPIDAEASIIDVLHPGSNRIPESPRKASRMSYGPRSRRPTSRGGIIGSAIAGVLVLVGIAFAALSCSTPSSPAATGPTTTVVPVTVTVPPPVTVVPAPVTTIVVVTPVYTPPRGVNAGSGGAADPGDGALDTGTVVLLLGGALLVLGGGIALARRRVS